mgnify:CR=1 FL=1
MTDHVRVEVSNGVLTLTLARPEKMNALSNEMYSALADTLERAESDQGQGLSCSRVRESTSPPATTWATSLKGLLMIKPSVRPSDISGLSPGPRSRLLPLCRETRLASARRCCCIP